jgi:hypothetical protein
MFGYNITSACKGGNAPRKRVRDTSELKIINILLLIFLSEVSKLVILISVAAYFSLLISQI